MPGCGKHFSVYIGGFSTFACESREAVCGAKQDLCDACITIPDYSTVNTRTLKLIETNDDVFRHLHDMISQHVRCKTIPAHQMNKEYYYEAGRDARKVKKEKEKIDQDIEEQGQETMNKVIRDDLLNAKGCGKPFGMIRKKYASVATPGICQEGNLCPDCDDTPKEKQIVEERAKVRGDFKIMMKSFTRIIEAKLSVALQQEVKLNDDFGSWILVDLKSLRSAFTFDEDNGDDAYNYLDIARKIGAENE